MLKQLVGDNSPDEEEMDSTPQQQQMQKIEQQEATKPQAVVKVLSKNEPSIIQEANKPEPAQKKQIELPKKKTEAPKPVSHS